MGFGRFRDYKNPAIYNGTRKEFLGPLAFTSMLWFKSVYFTDTFAVEIDLHLQLDSWPIFCSNDQVSPLLHFVCYQTPLTLQP